ncbi:MAG: DUF61 family protein [Candidatus Methanomethylophilus sp.]|jgi:uncharacterized protein (UPF0216 family)|nr:DUF61 family protein [Methanomethylophilus sp.]MCI2075293.1 DUF61 family protein [Methanomethylophilus sp.]MCI2092635.1 DUF61 family protein [Methanomethylophilus sp.]TQS82652.1 MAG: hypothetical protein A3Q59_03980 [Methanomethylophilus alvi]
MEFGIEDDPRNIKAMLAGMNSELPVRRRTLMDYIENGGDTFETRSGEKASFSRAGIDYLSSICTDQEKILLKLPLFVSTDTTSEEGGWKIDGTVETAVVARILGRRVHSEDRIRLYYPDLMRLKKCIPGLIFTVFTP